MADETIETRSPLSRGLISRRTALTGLGLGVAALVAGCDQQPLRTGRALASRAAEEPVLNWSNWPDYIDVGEDGLSHPTLDQFTKQTGITVH
jgi:spermidine/putrescine transport system substrate-binding protein